jgi:hypothetical protein
MTTGPARPRVPFNDPGQKAFCSDCPDQGLPRRATALYQGTTSVVPYDGVMKEGFSPCTRIAVAKAHSFGLAHRHELSHARLKLALVSKDSQQEIGGTSH